MPPPPPRTSGLYHFAILLPSRVELAKVIQRLIDAGYPLDGASDHSVSEAIYLRDPDSIGIELYRDRPRGEWKYDEHGNVTMVTEALNIDDLLGELEQ